MSFKENLSVFARSKTGSWFPKKNFLEFGLRPSGGDCSEEQLCSFSLVKYSIGDYFKKKKKSILKRLIFSVWNFFNFRVVLHAVHICTMWLGRAAGLAVGTKDKYNSVVFSVVMNCISGSAAMDNSMTEQGLSMAKPDLLLFPQGSC